MSLEIDLLTKLDSYRETGCDLLLSTCLWLPDQSIEESLAGPRAALGMTSR